MSYDRTYQIFTLAPQNVAIDNSMYVRVCPWAAYDEGSLWFSGDIMQTGVISQTPDLSLTLGDAGNYPKVISGFILWYVTADEGNGGQFTASDITYRWFIDVSFTKN